MKKIISTLLVLSFNSVFATPDVDVICVSSFNQQVYNLVTERNATCLADFVWGYESVCYAGNPDTLVELMNDEYFNTQSMSVKEASLNSDGSISYRGVDSRNFYSAKRQILECVE